MDIPKSDSIERMFESVGEIDAVVCIAGEAEWAPFDSMNEDDFHIAVRSKLMGQVNLVRVDGISNAGGSFTLPRDLADFRAPDHERCHGEWRHP